MKKTTQKIFTLRAISIAAFIGSPLAAGFLIYKNFKSFGNRKAAKITLLTCALFTIIAVTIFFTIPERLDSKYIKVVLPLLYSTLTAFVADKFQGKLIDEHLQKNFSKASWLLVPVYSLITLAMVIGIYYVSMHTLPFKGYEKTDFLYPDVRLHAQSEIEQKDFTKIGYLIKTSKYFEGTKSDLFLDKSGNKFKLTILFKDSTKFTDQENAEGIVFFQNHMNYCFSNKNEIEVVHSDKYFSKKFILEDINPQKNSFYEKYKNLDVQYIGNNQIYYDNNISKDDIDKLVKAISKLKYYFPENKYLTIILFDSQNEFDLVLNIHHINWNNKEIIDRLQEVEDYINYSNLTKTVRINLLDLSVFHMKKLNQST